MASHSLDSDRRTFPAASVQRHTSGITRVDMEASLDHPLVHCSEDTYFFYNNQLTVQFTDFSTLMLLVASGVFVLVS